MFRESSRKLNGIARVASSSIKPKARLDNDAHPMAEAATFIEAFEDIKNQITVAVSNRERLENDLTILAARGVATGAIVEHKRSALQDVRLELKRLRGIDWRIRMDAWGRVFVSVARELLPPDRYDEIYRATQIAMAGAPDKLKRKDAA